MPLSIAFSLFDFMAVLLIVKITVSVSFWALWDPGPVWNLIPECTQSSSHHRLLCGSGVSNRMCRSGPVDVSCLLCVCVCLVSWSRLTKWLETDHLVQAQERVKDCPGWWLQLEICFDLKLDYQRKLARKCFVWWCFNDFIFILLGIKLLVQGYSIPPCCCVGKCTF